MQNTHDGLKAQSLLKTFEEESGVNPSGYFTIVAESLLGRFGERAISIAADAIQKMRLLGDDDGRLLWESVSAEIWDRIDRRPRTASPVLH